MGTCERFGNGIETPKGQKARVLQWLVLYKSITPYEAYREFGIMRLAAVIFELRDPNGEYRLNIDTQMQEATNRFGEKVRFAKYVLKEGDTDGERP